MLKDHWRMTGDALRGGLASAVALRDRFTYTPGRDAPMVCNCDALPHVHVHLGDYGKAEVLTRGDVIMVGENGFARMKGQS